MAEPGSSKSKGKSILPDGEEDREKSAKNEQIASLMSIIDSYEGVMKEVVGWEYVCNYARDLLEETDLEAFGRYNSQALATAFLLVSSKRINIHQDVLELISRHNKEMLAEYLLALQAPQLWHDADPAVDVAPVAAEPVANTELVDPVSAPVVPANVVVPANIPQEVPNLGSALVPHAAHQLDHVAPMAVPQQVAQPRHNLLCRTEVDLKDKWFNLLRTARLPPERRRGASRDISADTIQTIQRIVEQNAVAAAAAAAAGGEGGRGRRGTAAGRERGRRGGRG
ncbi:hypothetical protein OROGR_011723 [Orobanche gracilis]